MSSRDRGMHAAAGIVGQHNLPEDLTSLIGRDADRVRVGEWVAAYRVVSLVGVGGVGKTRLALAVARTAVLDFPDGIWLIELASGTDAQLVPGPVAVWVGLAPSP